MVAQSIWWGLLLAVYFSLILAYFSENRRNGGSLANSGLFVRSPGWLFHVIKQETCILYKFQLPPQKPYENQNSQHARQGASSPTDAEDPGHDMRCIPHPTV
jgi:hypothetical protein